MIKILQIFLLIILSACQGVESTQNTFENNSSDSLLNNTSESTIDSAIKINESFKHKVDSSLFCDIDTLKIIYFWKKLMKGVQTKNKKVVLECFNDDFEFFLGMLIPYPQFMKNCDTTVFANSDDYYGIRKYNKSNFDYYYDSIFTESFKEMLQGIEIDSIIKNSMNTGYSFVYNYSPSIKKFPCSHEKVLIINLFYCGKPSITLSFCC